ncbi:hypothetical protein ASPZODRAFT_20635 [Penicilliopsis zonata CBS 506.65]|uniref:Zn(2)-C6 fungal-type domain-containing protein n=1 Tax=Penicilliopsis zonata CBS 506.65 TaxID=1073090 RepID=A0A1L9S584_9EURO|nr:hypothetical protein ASPZODRAFT_20635 [Penicilliopsis zonata CBS 506.65]OJJ42312.1 hypothetical protein ASPZODRAFT_20635 [Penicilliopsis zonata CBS 506.65]
MDSSCRESRIKKRSSNACQRCRRQKVKCSGYQPCETCNKRKLPCIFDDRVQKVLVTRGHLEDLYRQIALLEHGEAPADHQPVAHNVDDHAPGLLFASSSSPAAAEAGVDEDNGEEDASSNLTNPLSTRPSTYMVAASGRSYYLGTSSNWSFARRVLCMMHQHVHHSPPATDQLLFDGSAYDLDIEPGMTTAPSFDYSLHLLHVVDFHTGQLFHLFDHATFMAGLYAFYQDPEAHTAAPSLWYIHYLLIMAFGKAFVVQRSPGRRPPGGEFFARALQLVPDMPRLCQEPILATEMLCCLALYLQSLDFRHSAYISIGQAVRIAMAQGMHTDMPVDQLGEAEVQRCRRIWWTVYVLDRQLTSLMGLPQSIRDDQLHEQLPCMPDALAGSSKIIALWMQIRICRIMEEINSTVYGPDGRFNRRFLLKTKSTLASIVELAHDLSKAYELRLDEPRVTGVSRLAAHLHLLHHQCIVLATRPVLCCFLQLKLQAADDLSLENSSGNVRKLMQVCLESARQMLTILTVLQQQNLLDSFLTFDLDATFTSAVVLTIAQAIDPAMLDDWQAWTAKSHAVLDEMKSRGNLIAGFRKAELQMLAHLVADLQSSPDPLVELTIPEVGRDPEELTTELMAVAESIVTGDVDWIANTFTEDRMW